MTSTNRLIKNLSKIFQFARDWVSIDGEDKVEIGWINDTEETISTTLAGAKISNKKIQEWIDLLDEQIQLEEQESWVNDTEEYRQLRIRVFNFGEIKDALKRLGAIEAHPVNEELVAILTTIKEKLGQLGNSSEQGLLWLANKENSFDLVCEPGPDDRKVFSMIIPNEDIGVIPKGDTPNEAIFNAISQVKNLDKKNDRNK